MRKFAMFLFFSFTILNVSSQVVESKNRLLTVQRTRNGHKISYIIKPGKKLKIVTNDKYNLSITDYSFINDGIILSQMDTVYFNEIIRINGRVFGNEGRKILGGFISFISIPAAGMGGFLASWSGIPGVVGALPFVGSFIGGISLMVPRTFNTSSKWSLVLQE